MLWVQLYDTQGRHRHEGVRRGNNREMEVKIRELLAVSHPEVAKIELDLILPPQNVSLSRAVLMRKGSEDDEVEAGTLHA